MLTFPTTVLAYLDVAVDGPLHPGTLAHRAKSYRVTVVHRGERHADYLVGAACQPATTRPAPQLPTDDGDPEDETVPVTACVMVSAAWAQAHGVTRCTDPACWPPLAGERLTIADADLPAAA